MTDRKIRFNRYIVKYIRKIPLGDIDALKTGVEELDGFCKLEYIGDGDVAHYLCEEMVAGRNKERALESAIGMLPDIPKDNMALFTDKGKRLVI